MFIKRLLKKVDKLLCHYIGLEEEEVRPTAVQIMNNKLVLHTTSFRRHATKESWEDFSTIALNQTNLANREKLGLATGKAIAKNLVVTFEEPAIKEVQNVNQSD